MKIMKMILIVSIKVLTKVMIRSMNNKIIQKYKMNKTTFKMILMTMNLTIKTNKFNKLITIN